MSIKEQITERGSMPPFEKILPHRDWTNGGIRVVFDIHTRDIYKELCRYSFLCAVTQIKRVRDLPFLCRVVRNTSHTEFILSLSCQSQTFLSGRKEKFTRLLNTFSIVVLRTKSPVILRYFTIFLCMCMYCVLWEKMIRYILPT